MRPKQHWLQKNLAQKTIGKMNKVKRVLLKRWWLKVILVFSLGIGRAEQQLSPDLSFVIQTYGPNFRPAVNILLLNFGGGLFLL